MTGFVLRAYPELDESYAALSQWSGFAIDHLLFTDGADGGLQRIFATYVAEGDQVVIMRPSYAMYPVYCQMFGAEPTVLEFDDDLTLPFERVLEAARPGVRLFALVNPNQPIESCFSLEELRTLAQRCLDNGTIFLVDEAYYHFCQITAAPLIDQFENIVVARTFSKAFGLAGLRMGYLIANPAFTSALAALKPIYEINHLNAAIAAYFLKRPEIMQSYVEAVNQGRQVLTAFFTDHGCALHGVHSNTILAGLPERISALKVTQSLHQDGWLVRSETKPPTPNHLRITIGPPDLMKDLCHRLRVFF